MSFKTRGQKKAIVGKCMDILEHQPTVTGAEIRKGLKFLKGKSKKVKIGGKN